MGFLAKARHVDITGVRTNHIGCLNRFDGYWGPLDDKIKTSFHSRTDDSEVDDGALLSTQFPDDGSPRHLHTCDERVVDPHDAVSGTDSDLLRRSIEGRLDDYQRVVDDVELYPDAVEIALKTLLHGLGLIGSHIRRVGVEAFQHSADAVLDKLCLVDRIDVDVVYEHLSELKFPHRIVLRRMECQLRTDKKRDEEQQQCCSAPL